MNKESISRRTFFNLLKDSAGKSVILLSMPAILAACSDAKRARLGGENFQTLSEEEANEFDAIAARILPATSTPGARQAGVIYFIDQVLGDRREEQIVLLRDGLRELQAETLVQFDAAYFYLLEEAQQDEILASIESTSFFRTIRYLSVAGMFALPDYGGNRDLTGYQVIDYENQGAWTAPYGFYDADFTERGE